MSSPQRSTLSPVASGADHDVTAGAVVRPQRVRYPDIEPYDERMLDVGDGQSLHVEQSGNPDGIPVVFVHGGPGGGIGRDYRGFFDPELFRIIGFDQRGCGLSTPHVSQLHDAAQMASNTTAHLVGDMERLRTELGIELWGVFGGSWGSTLSLAYAEQFPERVNWLVLRGIFTLRRSELDWYYNAGASMVYPEHWQHFLAPLRRAGFDLDGDNIVGYHRLLWSEDHELARAAGLAWTRWEAATSSLLYSAEHVEESSDPDAALAFARIENHYFAHHGFLRENQLIEQAGRIGDIDGVIVQGRYDMCCPAATSHELHKAWPRADYRVVMAGHSAFEPNITSELVLATDRLAARG